MTFKLAGTLAAVCAVTGVSAVTAAAARRADAVRSDRTVTQTLHFSGAGPHTVDVRTITGAIQVSAYDGTDVEVSAHRTVWADDDAAARQAERDVTFEFSENAADVRAVVHERDQVCGDQSFHSRAWFEPAYHVRVDFTVRVPKDARIRLCSINGGDITVDGTGGDFDVSNVNGRITMTAIRGSGRAMTVIGPVTVGFLANPAARSEFRTINGAVEVTFVDALSADLHMKTMHGDLLTDFEVQPLPSTIERREGRDGGRGVFVNRYTSVRAGRGGPELTFDTLNGDIRILRRAR